MKLRPVAKRNGPHVGSPPLNRRLFHGLFLATGVRDTLGVLRLIKISVSWQAIHWPPWFGVSIAGPEKSLMADTL